MINSGFFSSESVTEGHPDKICDQISDRILDAVLSEDPKARVACETFVGYNHSESRGFVLVSGEIGYEGAPVPYDRIVRDTLKTIGYTHPSLGIYSEDFEFILRMNTQSQDIAQGVDVDGAGDQGMMFGFAINETPQKMPLPISLSHQLAKRLAEVRKSDLSSFLGPDGKAQVSLKYKNKHPEYISDVVLSSQHKADIPIEEVREFLQQAVISKALPASLLREDTRFHINPTGRFVIGGPQGDTGLTGRKIIVDTYGGFARHGGGAFSGKDGTKVDRSGAYMARYIAKNVVASELADICEIQLAYAIGKPNPVSIYVDTYGTGKFKDEDIAKCIWEIFPLTPSGIIRLLDLDQPIFHKTSVYGHFGKEGLSWEKEDQIGAIRQYFHL